MFSGGADALAKAVYLQYTVVAHIVEGAQSADIAVFWNGLRVNLKLITLLFCMKGLIKGGVCRFKLNGLKFERFWLLHF